MTTDEPMGGLIQGLLERVFLNPLYKLLDKLSPRGRFFLILVISGLFFAVAAIAFTHLLLYTGFMSAILRQPLETNDQPYRGVEAYLLSPLPDSASGLVSPPETARQLAALPAAVRRFSPDQGPFTQLAADSFRIVGSAPSRSQFVTAGLHDAFLFHPALTLQSSQAVTGWTDALVRSELPRNREVAGDIAAAIQLLPTLVSLDGARVDTLAVSQSYLIMEGGTLLIRRNAQPQDPVSPFRGFEPRRFFPERPYFWRALSHERRAGVFDYVSHPYIDYGGLGVVRTYVVAFTLPSGRSGVLALDCALPGGDNAIESRISRLRPIQSQFLPLHVKAAKVVVDSSGDALIVEGDPAFVTFLDKVKLREQQRKRRTGALITGQIICDHDYGVRGNTFGFSVPLRAVQTDEGDGTELLLAEFDMNVLRGLWIPALACIVLSVLLGGIFHFLYYQEIRQRIEQEDLMERISRVMSDAPIPFVWLNERNEFLFANDALIMGLGFDSADDLKKGLSGTPRTWRAMLWSMAEQAHYDELMERSRSGGYTDAYWCSVRAKDGTRRHLRVHGERVPFGGEWRGKMPHRFGVVLETGQASAPPEPPRG